MEPTNLVPMQDADALIKLGRAARQQGDRAAALAAFEAAAAARPNQVGLKVETATELRVLGRLDEASALLQQALAIEPDNGHALNELGHLARRGGDRSAALAAFAAAAAAQPNSVGPKAEAATELRVLGRIDEASALLQQALAIAPKNAHALSELGHLARRRGDRIGALAAFETAAAANPNHAGLKAEAAAELRDLGRFDEAEAMLKQALAIDPHHFASLIALGQVARRRGDHVAALAAFEFRHRCPSEPSRFEGGCRNRVARARASRRGGIVAA